MATVKGTHYHYEGAYFVACRDRDVGWNIAIRSNERLQHSVVFLLLYASNRKECEILAPRLRCARRGGSRVSSPSARDRTVRVAMRDVIESDAFAVHMVHGGGNKQEREALRADVT